MHEKAGFKNAWIILLLGLIVGCSSTDVRRLPSNPDPLIKGEMTEDKARRALEMKLFDDRKDSIRLTNLVEHVVDKDAQEKIDIETIRDSPEVLALRVQELLRQLGAEGLGIPQQQGDA